MIHRAKPWDRSRSYVNRWTEFDERNPQLCALCGCASFNAHRDTLEENGEESSISPTGCSSSSSRWRNITRRRSARRVFYQLVLPESSARESSRDYDWVAKAIAWSWSERFIAENAYVNRDARTLGPVQFFSSSSPDDRQTAIYAPQFAFTDVFYDSIYPNDRVRDDVLRFNHERTHGRTVYAHLEDAVGPDKAAQIAGEYLARPGIPFLTLAQEISKMPLRAKFEEWVSPRPRVNYVLERVAKREIDHEYEYRVTVRREAKKPLEEPVELGVTTMSDQHQLLKWGRLKRSMIMFFKRNRPYAR